MWLRFLVSAGLCLFLTDLSAQTFVEVAGSLGISEEYGSGELGGGVSFADYNGDGLDDLTFPTGVNRPLLFYRNTGSGFQQEFPVTNNQHTKEAVWADYDNDGDQDLFVTAFSGADRLYRNDGGGLTDVTVSAFGSLDGRRNFGAAWGDYNRDGYLDLYVCGYGEPNRLWRGSAAGTFTDVAPQLGVTDHPSSASFDACIVDVDGNGWPDIYVVNDKVNEANALFLNDGGTFTLAVNAGADISIDAMNAGGGDYDNDGDFDFYVTNTEAGNALLLNDGTGSFVDVAEATGVAVGANCWGANFLDYDNDTDLDLYVSAEAYGGFFANPFFDNQGDGSFLYPLQLSGGLGGSDNGQSYGNAVGDWNGDGRPDIVVSQVHTNFFLWENRQAGTGNYLDVQLTGTLSNRDGIGARVEVDVDGQTLSRWQLGSEGYLSQNSRRLHFGLGPATSVSEVRVYWPSGTVDTYHQLNDLNLTWSFTEGETTLPVVLAEIRADVVGKAVDLIWVTASENGSSHFGVERSRDGVDFLPVGRVGAAGHSSSPRQYQFTDPNPGVGPWVYRLRLVDLDGTVAYSPLRTVNLADPADTIFLRSPVMRADGKLQLALTTRRGTDVRLGIFDSFGRCLRSFSLRLPPGTSSHAVAVNGWPAGGYFLTGETRDGIETCAFVLSR